MFKLPTPFRLLPDADKLGFRSSPGGIARLASARHITDNDKYWDQYTVLFDSASDVFSLITPHDIRRALLEAPENVATLIRVITSRMNTLMSDHTFPTSQNASVAALASSFMQAGTERNTTKEVLNCLRILGRVFPVIFDLEGEGSAFETEVLWTRGESVEEIVGTASETPQFVIDDEDDSDVETKDPSPRPGSKPSKKQLPSLAEKLFTSLLDLLFCYGFTLPAKQPGDHHKFNHVIWEKGVGSTTDGIPNQAYDNNKIEVLRLFLVLLSRQIYVSPGSLLSKPSLYSLHAVQNLPRRDVLTVLCSLLNTAMNSPGVTPMTLGGMAGKLPYNHLVFKGDDLRSNLVGLCLQVLVVLLDFQSGSARDGSTSNDESLAAPTARTNAFRYFLMKLHRTQDFTFVLNGITGIFEEQMATMNMLLPGARKSIPYINETVLFFWKMIELNKKFRAFLLESEKGMDLVGYLLCYTLEIKDKPEQHGLCRALSYIVQTLSAEPSFGARLSRPVKAQLPAKWNAPGTAADFLINAIYAIVATTSGALNSLYPALVIALSNSAPYFQNLTVTASARLIQLFASFSNPMFLLSDEGHPRLLFFMLEVFNGVILRNLKANPNLIYGIISSHKTFEDLGTFTLSRGLREIRRMQLAKEEQARKIDAKGKRPMGSGENLQPHEEKAKLLRSESESTLPEGAPLESTLSLEDEGATSQEPEISTVLPAAQMSVPASPTSESAPLASEKARGKMKARRSHSLDVNGPLDRVAAAGVGRNGFVPTQEWVTSWQQGLPLDTVMLLISELMPKVQELQANRHRTTSTSAIVDYLGAVSLENVLPAAPELSPRRFMWSDSSVIWLTSLIWGEIYVRGMTPLGIWNATNVRLFYVKHAPTQQRQLTEAVTNVMGGLWGRTAEPIRART